MTDHPKAKGDRTTLAVMLGLHEAGFAVSVPFGENTRYDLIIDDGTYLPASSARRGGYGSADSLGDMQFVRSSPEPADGPAELHR